ncbi:endoplasmic reticulum-Golgi intermediate compartment protein 2-like [Oscarella lobularis]|uniref:endoplasmic reticulum-Golgi intermediate compartment protein 2-like n=1 Tax=Oscarella lobularis TaxID=121494 RepID=UPI0033139228
MVRRLNRRERALKAVQQLDAFPKHEESVQEKTSSGGTVSILTFTLITILVVSEFLYYRHLEYVYAYGVDTDLDGSLLFNIDIVVAMPCDYIGADLLDLAGTTHHASDKLKQEPTFFDLTKNQEKWIRARKELIAKHEEWRSLKEEHMSNYASVHTPMPPRLDSEAPEDKKPDSCRIHGSMEVQKIAGNFHITAGKSMPHPRGHAHLSAFIPRESFNFSHRINRLSFGFAAIGTFNPLDGELKITEERNQMFQYYLQIVPTQFQRVTGANYSANQYSVTERERVIDHSGGSHGVPGIFMKYDLSSLMVQITQVRRPVGLFLVRLCGIIGGVFATSGMLHSIIGLIFDIIFCRRTTSTSSQDPASVSNTSSSNPTTPSTPTADHTLSEKTS